jgi:hypothetical protein
LTNEWIEAAKRQLTAAPGAFSSTLHHVLGFATELPPEGGSHESSKESSKKDVDRTVLISGSDPELDRALTSAGLKPTVISFTKYDAQAAAKVNHFETYNRTPASQRVADIVAAVRAHPNAALVADGDAALAAILARAVVPIRLAVLDVAGFDSSSDQAFVDHLYIPGLRRAGDLQTAAAMSAGEIVVHDGGSAFNVPSLKGKAAKLTSAEIAAIVRKSPSNRGR